MSDKVERNPCGHPVACVVTEGTTSHCAWCADQEQFHARIELQILRGRLEAPGRDEDLIRLGGQRQNVAHPAGG